MAGLHARHMQRVANIARVCESVNPRDRTINQTTQEKKIHIEILHGSTN